MSYYELHADKTNYLRIRKSDCLTHIAHFHNAIELVFLKKGELEVCINGVKHDILEGEVAYSGSFDIHYYNLKENSEVYVIVASQDYLKEFNNFVGCKHLNNIIKAPSCLFDFLDEWIKEIDSENKLMSTAKLLHILAKLSDGNLVEKTIAPKSEFVSNIFQFIHKNFKSNISVSKIAEKFGYSRGYISTMFTAYTGEGFNAYINRLRVLSASKEIEKNDGRKILDIAFENGFESANTFYRAYKKQFGHSPLQNSEIIDVAITME